MIRCDCAKVEFKFIIFYELLTEHFWPSIVVKNLLSPRGKIHSSHELEKIRSDNFSLTWSFNRVVLTPASAAHPLRSGHAGGTLVVEGGNR